MKAKRGLSDGLLLKRWREVVLKRWGYECIVCGRGGELEAHHIVPRRHLVLRYDPDNGVPVHGREPCPFGAGESCHSWAQSLAGEDYLRERVGEVVWKRLASMQNVTMPAWLAKTGLTREQWRAQMKAQLEVQG